MLNDFTVNEEEDLFSLRQYPVLPYEKPDNTWISVTIEMDFSLQTYERTLYTLFDMLSDIGGLSGILIAILALIVSAWTYNSFDNAMVRDLY